MLWWIPLVASLAGKVAGNLYGGPAPDIKPPTTLNDSQKWDARSMVRPKFQPLYGEAYRRGRQTQARASAGLYSRGLGKSGVSASVEAGIMSDTANTVGGIDADRAAAEAQAEYAKLQELRQNYMMQFQRDTDERAYKRSFFDDAIDTGTSLFLLDALGGAEKNGGKAAANMFTKGQPAENYGGIDLTQNVDLGSMFNWQFSSWRPPR